MHGFIRRILALVLFTVLVAATLPAQSQATARVSITPASQLLRVGETTRITVDVADVQGLYALDITLQYDPAVLEVVGSTLDQQIVQVTAGSFMDPGSIIVNEADNTTGIVHYEMAEISPSQPKSGSGVLFTMNVRARNIGTASKLTLTRVQLAQQNTLLIPVSTISSQISVNQLAPGNPTQTSVPTPASSPTSQPSATLTPTSLEPTPASTSMIATNAPTIPPTDVTPLVASTLTPTPVTSDPTAPPVMPSPAPTTAMVATPSPNSKGQAPPIATAVRATDPPSRTTFPTATPIAATAPFTLAVPATSLTPVTTIQASGLITNSPISQPGVPGDHSPSQEHAPQIDIRSQLTRAGLETLIAFALCGIGFIVLAASVAIFYFVMRSAAPTDVRDRTNR